MTSPASFRPGLAANLRYDLPAGLVVALVALPLCLGIALASEAPLVGGLVAGIVGGLVIGPLSGSALSVSGPAAGLTAIVAGGIHACGSYERFLVSVVMSGAIQVLLGAARLGFVTSFVPHSVIQGMLAGIGVLIILKQIPHALGRDMDFEGDESLFQNLDHENSFSEILLAVTGVTPGPVLVAAACLAVLLAWESPWMKKQAWARLLPAGLVVVALGIGLNALFAAVAPGLVIQGEAGHMVQLPVFDGPAGLLASLARPDWSAAGDPAVWSTALAIALVGSVESLLSLEAVDKLDPFRRPSPKNRELLAQGVGNALSGLLGGLPVTAVIVRSSANVYAGGRTRTSAVAHGLVLAAAVVLAPGLLNRIPLAALAAILLVVGYKLARVSLFLEMRENGLDQWLPFGVTIVAILASDVLTGVLVGFAVGAACVIWSNHYSALLIVNEGPEYLVKFKKDVSFMNKSRLHEMLAGIPSGSRVVIDGTRAMFIDHDIYEVIEDFRHSAAHRHIRVDLHNLHGKRFSRLHKRG